MNVERQIFPQGMPTQTEPLLLKRKTGNRLNRSKKVFDRQRWQSQSGQFKRGYRATHTASVNTSTAKYNSRWKRTGGHSNKFHPLLRGNSGSWVRGCRLFRPLSPWAKANASHASLRPDHKGQRLMLSQEESLLLKKSFLVNQPDSCRSMRAYACRPLITNPPNHGGHSRSMCPPRKRRGGRGMTDQAMISPKDSLPAA